MNCQVKLRNPLSGCEAVVMKIIWDAGEPVSCRKIMDILEQRYGLCYKDTTVYTFLKKMLEKGFINSYKKGVTFYLPIKTEHEYTMELLSDFVTLWYAGNKDQLKQDLDQC